MLSIALDILGASVNMVTPSLDAVAWRSAPLLHRTVLKTVSPSVRELPRSTVAPEKDVVVVNGRISAPPTVLPADTRTTSVKKIGVNYFSN